MPRGLLGWRETVVNHKTAIFRQINKDRAAAHHDALEFPDGEIVLLTCLCEDQRATVLQLPAEPKTAVESQVERRAPRVGLPVSRLRLNSNWAILRVGWPFCHHAENRLGRSHALAREALAVAP